MGTNRPGSARIAHLRRMPKASRNPLTVGVRPNKPEGIQPACNLRRLLAGCQPRTDLGLAHLENLTVPFLYGIELAGSGGGATAFGYLSGALGNAHSAHMMIKAPMTITTPTGKAPMPRNSR